MLSEVSHTEKDVYFIFHLNVESKNKTKQMNEQHKTNKIDTEIKLVVARGEGYWGLGKMSKGA